jgi:hypothetical protein
MDGYSAWTSLMDGYSILRRVESTSGINEGWGFLYLPTSEKAVTRRKPPLLFLRGRMGSGILQQRLGPLDVETPLFAQVRRT